jgi:hypothetical protein
MADRLGETPFGDAFGQGPPRRDRRFGETAQEIEPVEKRAAEPGGERGTRPGGESADRLETEMGERTMRRGVEPQRDDGQGRDGFALPARRHDAAATAFGDGTRRGARARDRGPHDETEAAEARRGVFDHVSFSSEQMRGPGDVEQQTVLSVEADEGRPAFGPVGERGEEARRAVKLILACYQSARTGQIVEL